MFEHPSSSCCFPPWRTAERRLGSAAHPKVRCEGGTRGWRKDGLASGDAAGEGYAGRDDHRGGGGEGCERDEKGAHGRSPVRRRSCPGQATGTTDAAALIVSEAKATAATSEAKLNCSVWRRVDMVETPWSFQPPNHPATDARDFAGVVPVS